jgi:hypothetical protein
MRAGVAVIARITPDPACSIWRAAAVAVTNWVYH